MKKGIHPENYRLVAFKDMSNDTVFITRSCATTKETLMVDGVEYPVVKVEIRDTRADRNNFFCFNIKKIRSSIPERIFLYLCYVYRFLETLITLF